MISNAPLMQILAEEGIFIADMPLGDEPDYIEGSYEVDFSTLEEDICSFGEK